MPLVKSFTLFKFLIKQMGSSSLLFRLAKGKKVIFLYHDISEENSEHFSPYYSTPKKLFIEQIEYLRQFFEFVPLNTLVGDTLSSNRKQYASIVFDDGFYSLYKHAYPLLAKKQTPFTVFINKNAILNNYLWVTDLILNKNKTRYLLEFYNLFIDQTQITFDTFQEDPLSYSFETIKFNHPLFLERNKNTVAVEKLFCDREDIREMLSSNLVSLGSHSCNHYILSRCNSELLKKEIIENKQFMDELSPTGNHHFAIPFGKQADYDDRVIKACEEAGHRYIYTNEPYSFSIPKIKGSTWIFPRIAITNQSVQEMIFLINRQLFQKTTSEDLL